MCPKKFRVKSFCVEQLLLNRSYHVIICFIIAQLDPICQHFKEKFDIEVLPNEDSGHFQTMGGFITSYFGYIPKVGEKIIWHKFRFEIISMDKARIDRILVTQINKK